MKNRLLLAAAVMVTILACTWRIVVVLESIDNHLDWIERDIENH